MLVIEDDGVGLSEERTNGSTERRPDASLGTDIVDRLSDALGALVHRDVSQGGTGLRVTTSWDA